MSSRPEDGQGVDVLLVGGGVAAAAAAEELRRQGFQGSIALATRENEPPYYRFYLTKEYLRGQIARDELSVHSPEWWEQNKVELWLRSPVMHLDLAQRTATVGRRTVHWNQVLLATGANVRTLDCPGAGLAGIHYLRTTWTADALREDLAVARSAVVVGGSFVAAETAASLAATGIATTMVFPEDLPLATALGAEIAAVVCVELRRLGVALRAGTTVEEFCGEDRVRSAVLSSGQQLEADVVVIGIGAKPETMLAQKAGLKLAEIGGVECDQTLRASHPSAFAAGDVCAFDSVRHRRVTRIEHDRVAAAQGAHAARTMLGATDAFDAVPYFWTSIGDELRIDVHTVGDAGSTFRRLRPDEYQDGPAPQAFGQFHGEALVGLASMNGAIGIEAAHQAVATAGYVGSVSR